MKTHSLFPATFVLLVTSITTGGCTDVASHQPPRAATIPDTPLSRAASYLWSRQAADGGWHSETYALLHSGQALTPFILHALLRVPQEACPRPAAGVERALKFIRRHVNDEGVLGLADPDISEYPNYSTAYAVRCLIAAGLPEDQGLIDLMRRRLVAAQYFEASGFPASAPAYGGWGFDAARTPGEPGHMDLAHTRRVLEALREVGAGDEVFSRAIPFLWMVQRHPDGQRDQPLSNAGNDHEDSTYDGGFYFSPVVVAANKGRRADDPPRWRSYATATCDGVLALLAAGVPRDGARIVQALKWLEAHPDLDYPQGVPTDHPEPWGEAIRFYHYAVRGEVYSRLGWPADRKDRLAATVTARQNKNGSFANAVTLMKEDDPLLCTALALIALSASS